MLDRSSRRRDRRRYIRASVGRISGKLTYANVVSTLALFVALTGATAFAAGKVGSREIKVGAVKSKHIARNAVKPQKIARNAVRPRHIRVNAVGHKQIAPDSIDGSKVINGSLTAADFAGGLAAALGGGSIVATATGGPVEVTALSPSEPDPVPLANASWVQAPSQANLFAARVVATLQDVPEATSCNLFVDVRVDGETIGSFKLDDAGSTPTTVTGERLFEGARVPLGVPRQGQLSAVAFTGDLLNSCQFARVDSLRVVVLGIG